MKKFSLLFLFLFLSITFSNFSFSGTALVTSCDKGVYSVTWTNPYTLSPQNVYFEGTLNGTLDGNPAKFYCVDINHFLEWSGPAYIDGGNTSIKITYVLNNYYPFIPLPYAGALADTAREAAAIQMAIWYFSDGLDVTTLVDNADLVARAQAIIADANLNAGNMITDATLVITPTGIPTEFYVTALDQNNNPLPGVTITLSSTSGTVSSNVAVTGPDGKTPVLTVIPLRPDYTAQITAEATITVHKGTVYVRSNDPDNCQKLVLAYPYPLHRQVTFMYDGPLPVELSSFTSNALGRDVHLIWETKTEKNSDKFVIERKASDTWESIGSVKASVLSNSPKQYSYTDKNLQSDKYQYRLKMIDNDGTFEYSSTVEVVIEIPNEYSLMQNYPNPFNPSTVINYSTPQDGKVTLKVFDITGKELAVLVNENQKAGHYSVNFDASRLSSGVYFYTLNSGSFLAAKKLTLIK